MTRLGTHAVDGVIAEGTINGKRWRIKLTRKNERTCWARPGSGWAQDCLEPVGQTLKRWPGITGPADLWTLGPDIFGPVQPDVSVVSMRLSDGVTLSLYPVEAYGRRWIGLVLPTGLVPAEAVAYSGHTELAHSTPFVEGNLGGGAGFGFLTWLPPGDDGPARVTKVVRGGGWSLVLHTGPWGNCLVGNGGDWFFSLDDHPSGAQWRPPANGSHGVSVAGQVHQAGAV